ncbi:thiamine pyrophosphate-binding protein [Paralcaligenes ureilyticus]|uniref:Acetolactate synthase-1/2/3 large subunit/sulfoacetaldehyde acetyltransferase n=1 Tax=Paralcaligenes ureilyticus TaxID=627131 RepID=A0A4R3M724_9BURK|nr:thiamine pyrophosphate-binding protein [Paralcaligenes ureilyticus]TCT08882.1 acetolactate synthase-1/2/3 large subunit/sulfoacetaldehyde acetyltransferase [Paralcaligenes ureilyticus]
MAMNTGGEALVAALEEAGVRHVFGLLGSSTMEVYDALFEHPTIRYIGVRDERSGTHMADGYGRISGQPGVILAGQAGPGSSNLVTGLIQASLAFSPVVAITGLVSSSHIGRDTLQEFDQHGLFSPITKRTWNVPKVDRIPEFVREAFRYASLGRKGPVVLNIPRDLFAQSVETPQKMWDPRPNIHLGTPAPAQIDQIVQLIRKANAPLIISGGGIKAARASADLVALSEKTGIPVAASAGNTDVVPNDHPLFAGQAGPRGNAVASGLAHDADLILAIGTRLGFNTTFFEENFSPSAKIVHIDIDPLAVGRYYPIELGVVADAGLATAALLKALEGFDASQAPWRARNERFLKDRKALLDKRAELGASKNTPLNPAQVFAELRSVMPRDAIITLDAGTLCMQATDQLSYFEPPSLITPLDFGLVGMSFAAGIGAKLAAPDRPVVSLMGDGGFGIGMTEFTTAIQHDIPTVTVVMDNGCWGAEKAYQRDFYGKRYIGADITSPPYDEFARSCGGFGVRTTEPGETADAVREALKSGLPSIVHVKVDPDSIVSFRSDSFKHRAAKS